MIIEFPQNLRMDEARINCVALLKLECYLEISDRFKSNCSTAKNIIAGELL